MTPREHTCLGYMIHPRSMACTSSAASSACLAMLTARSVAEPPPTRPPRLNPLRISTRAGEDLTCAELGRARALPADLPAGVPTGERLLPGVPPPHGMLSESALPQRAIPVPGAAEHGRAAATRPAWEGGGREIDR